MSNPFERQLRTVPVPWSAQYCALGQHTDVTQHISAHGGEHRVCSRCGRVQCTAMACAPCIAGKS